MYGILALFNAAERCSWRCRILAVLPSLKGRKGNQVRMHAMYWWWPPALKTCFHFDKIHFWFSMGSLARPDQARHDGPCMKCHNHNLALTHKRYWETMWDSAWLHTWSGGLGLGRYSLPARRETAQNHTRDRQTDPFSAQRGIYSSVEYNPDGLANNSKIVIVEWTHIGEYMSVFKLCLLAKKHGDVCEQDKQDSK